MTVTEKAAYLKGLFAGLRIKEDTDEGKLFKAIIDTLDELALSVADLEDVTAELGSEIDDLVEDVSNIEEDLYEDEEDGEDLEDEELYKVICPTCGEELFIDEGVLAEKAINCPACGEELEFDVSAITCDCGCDCCSGEESSEE